jgi:DNA-binding phage protein
MYIGEYYNVSSFTALAVPFMHTMAEDIPYYRETGAGHINYMHIVTKRWGILAACNYQFSSLIWDHTADSDELLETYFSQRYGTLSEEMKRFYRILEQATANAKLWKHYAGMERHTLFRTLNQKGSPRDPAVITTTRHFTYSPGYRTRDNGPAMTETIALLGEAERIMDDILLQCSDPVLEKRLADDIQRFRFTKNMAEFIYRLMRLRMFENRGLELLAAKEARALRDAGETLRREDEMTQGQWNASRYRFYDNGLRATWFPVTYEEIMKDYSLETPDSESPREEHRLG